MDFQSELIDVNEITKEARVKIPATAFITAVDKEINKIQKNAKIDGFRPGKAPKDLVKKRYEATVSGQVINDCINESVREVIQKNDLKVVGTPIVDIKKYAEGDDLEFTATISLLPQPEIKNYDSLAIEVPADSINEENIEQVAKSYLKAYGTTREISDREVVEADDIINGKVVVFVGDVNSGSYDDYTIDLSEAVLDDIKKNLIGSKIGQEVEITLNLGQDGTALAPEAVTKYMITPSKISVRDLPALDDEFVKKLKMEGVETVEQLNTDIKARLEKELEQKQKNIIAEKTLKEIAEKNQFMIPQAMIDYQIRDILVNRRLMKREDVANPSFDVVPYRDMFTTEAEVLLRNAIILDTIAEQEKITVSEEEFQDEIHKDMKLYNIDHDALHRYFDNPQVREGKELQISRDKVLDFLKSKTKITIK